jgi:hypothetical protein
LPSGSTKRTNCIIRNLFEIIRDSLCKKSRRQ